MIFASAQSALTNFNLVFGVVATLSAIVLGFFGAKQKISLVSAEQEARILRGLNTTQDLQNKSLINQNKLLVQKAEVLEKHVTQAPQINDLAVQLATQHKDMMKAFSKGFSEQSANMNSIATELGNIAKAVIKESNAI